MSSIRSGAGLALATAALALAAACTEASHTTGPQTAPVAGGGLVLGIVGDPATLDPYSPEASDQTYELVTPIYPSLYRFLPGGSTQPYLARALRPVPGGIEVTLRHARWSNGRPITASDVVASVRRARRSATSRSIASASPGFAEVSSATSRSPRRVVLKGDVPNWAETLATAAFILPRGRPSRAVSGGPLVVDSSIKGLRLVYKPNPAWSGRRPYLHRLTVEFVEGMDELLALLAEGRLDAAVVPSAVNLGYRLGALGLDHAGTLGWESVYLDLRGASSISLREAIAGSIGRATIKRGLVRGGGRITDTLHPGPSPGGTTGPYAWSGAGLHTIIRRSRCLLPRETNCCSK
jgi:peptide/nickel transport system substrate-binding protein